MGFSMHTLCTHLKCKNETAGYTGQRSSHNALHVTVGEAPGAHDIRFRGGFQFKLKQVLQRAAPSDYTGEDGIWGLPWGAEEDSPLPG